MAKKLQILASCAEDCRFWDENLTSIGTLSGTDDSIDIVWSSSGENFAASRGTAGIEIAFFRGKEFKKTIMNVVGVEVTAICFINLSGKENLLLGMTSGEVLLWDQVWQKTIQKYSTNSCKSPVVRVQTNGSAIAAGHENGLVSVFGCSTSQLMQQFSVPDSMALMDLKFSPLKKSYLSASFESGSVALWDVHATKNQNPLLFHKNSHQAPATGIALSPINELLMLSSGLDRKIVLYDCPKKKIIKEIMADAPVTAVEFLSETKCFAAGTTKGKIHIYDLRSPAAPVRTFQAHTSAIKKLAASPPLEQQAITKAAYKLQGNMHTASAVKSAAEKEKQRRRSLSQGSVPQDQLLMTPLNSNGNNLQDEQSEISKRRSSLFSPLKTSLNVSLSKTPNLTLSPLVQNIQKNSFENMDVVQPAGGVENGGKTARNLNFSEVSATPSGEVPEKVEGTKERETSRPFDVEVIRSIVEESVHGLQLELSQGVFNIMWELVNKYHLLDEKLEKMNRQLQDRVALEDEIIKLREENKKLKSLY